MSIKSKYKNNSIDDCQIIGEHFWNNKNMCKFA